MRPLCLLIPLLSTALFSCNRTPEPTGELPIIPSHPSQRAKYVFYLISDGTGLNTILGTEQYLAELQKRWGRDTLCLSTFPVCGLASTYSYTHGITDSAASGTALSTGEKTYNGAIGVDTEGQDLYGLAQKAHDKHIPVGISTSVCINHATPASFYAHSSSRKRYTFIAQQLPFTDYDFFGGSDFYLEEPYNTPEYFSALYHACDSAGYVTVRSREAFEAAVSTSKPKKMIFFQNEARSEYDDFSLPYAIDLQPGEVNICDIFQAEVDFLYRRSQETGVGSFFLMSEIGGKVDFACHVNDGATAFHEVMQVDSCVRIAYNFYRQHPDETLIVFTSDHDTGGISLGTQEGGYVQNFSVLANQRCSLDSLTHALQALRVKTGNKVTWEQAYDVLHQNLGFGLNLRLSLYEIDELRDIWHKSFEGKMPNEKNLYSDNEPYAVAAVRILNDKAHLGWTTKGHTADLVPCFALGVGSEQFTTFNDNADIARKIARIANY